MYAKGLPTSPMRIYTKDLARLKAIKSKADGVGKGTSDQPTLAEALSMLLDMYLNDGCQLDHLDDGKSVCPDEVIHCYDCFGDRSIDNDQRAWHDNGHE